MSTEGWFSIPLHSEKAEGEEYDKIQKELFDTYNQLEFSQNPQWSADTHELSPNPFGGDTLFEYKCTNFLDFLNRVLKNYIGEVHLMSTPSSDKLEYQYIITSSWFTKTTKGKYAHEHDHHGLDISGVYYLQTNGHDGNLVLTNPLRMLSNNFIMFMTCCRDRKVGLEQGRLVLWPSFIKHRTETNTTDDDRISISFNIKITASNQQPL
tara:strand:- start:62 stop:688 length:627 start_codon:yes stop_codon:yes gene_type:complete